MYDYIGYNNSDDHDLNRKFEFLSEQSSSSSGILPLSILVGAPTPTDYLSRPKKRHRTETAPNTAKPASRYDQQFDKNLKELLEFKQQNGHCNVPQSWESNPKLGIWVNYIRQRFRDGKLSESRKARLESIGFLGRYGV